MHQFFREVVLYLLTKLGIIKPWTNIKSLSRFDLGLWQTSKWIFRKLQYKTIVVEDSQSFYCFPRKWFAVLITNLAFWNLEPLFHDSKNSDSQTPIYGENFCRVWKFVSISQKSGFAFVDQTWHYKTLNNCSITQKFRFRFFTDFKVIL